LYWQLDTPFDVEAAYVSWFAVVFPNEKADLLNRPCVGGYWARWFCGGFKKLTSRRVGKSAPEPTFTPN
jgi:hypothetical protein